MFSVLPSKLFPLVALLSSLAIRRALALPEACLRSMPSGATKILREIESEFSSALKCDESIDEKGGGWVVFQHNVLHYSDLFLRGKWTDYVRGFESPPQQQQRQSFRPGIEPEIFWMGLDNLARLTRNQKQRWQLMIKVRWTNTSAGVSAGGEGWAIWSDFVVADADDFFRLRVGQLTDYGNLPSVERYMDPKTMRVSTDGKVWDPLIIHSNERFSTKDRDNDGLGDASCSQAYRSGWWYNACYDLDLNRDPPAWFDGRNVHFLGETVMAMRVA